MNRNFQRALVLLGLSLVLSGCAVLRGPTAGQKLDPFESWNRKVFSFNESLDKAVLKPVATVYSEVVPSPVRQGVDNFFGNIGDAWSAFNMVLQGRLKLAVQQAMRFAVNSTFGFVGLLDVSSEVGLERNTEDLGMTFGRWGFGAGAYIVWPLFGPSSVRDTLALPWDRLASPALFVQSGSGKAAVTVLQITNARSKFLRAGAMLDDIALDKYTFYRDAYLQRRGSIESDEAYEALPAAAVDPATAASAAGPAASSPPVDPQIAR